MIWNKLKYPHQYKNYNRKQTCHQENKSFTVKYSAKISKLRR